MDVIVSVRNAIGGTDLDELHEAVKREYLHLDDQERSVRSVLAKWRADSSAASWSFNMNEEKRASVSRERDDLEPSGRRTAAHKLKARPSAPKSIWFGLGMSGLVGWSVTIPTLIGAALGIWIDQQFPSPYSWTLMFLFMGLIVGCLNAWLWVQSEYKEMQEDPDE